MQADSDSPEHHLHRAKAYADNQGWEVIEIYRLDGVSGRTVHEHSEMERMCTDVKSGRIQGLIFSSLTRLARKKSTLWDLADLFKEYSAALVCLDMAIDTSNPAGELVFSIFGALAEWEAQLTSERITKSTITRATLGKSLGGFAVFGYQWLDGRLVPNPDEAPIRRLIYELYFEYQSLKEVARILNQRGYTTRAGKSWNCFYVGKMIKDTTAKGEHIKNRKNPSSLRNKIGKYKDRSEWIITKVEPIVSIELWENCKKLADRQHQKFGRKNIYPFSGLIECGQCKAKMYPDGNRFPYKKYRCTKCYKGFHVEVLEKVFKDKAWEFFDPYSQNYVNKIDSDIDYHNSLLKKQAQKLKKFEQSIERADEDYLSGTLAANRYEALLKKLEVNIDIVKTEIAQLTGRIDALKSKRQSTGPTVEKIQGKLIRWDSLSKTEKQAFARELIERLEFNDGEIVIEICASIEFSSE